MAHVTNDNDSVNTEFTTAWQDLSSSFSAGVFSIQLPISRHNRNLRFDFEVRIGHDAVSGWFVPAGPTPSVTITDPLPKK